MLKDRNVSAGEAGGLLDRPLGARSIILSLLLGRRSAVAPVAELVRWCALFGVPEGTARVALSRAVAGGELRADRGSYAIVGRLRGRQADQELALTGDLVRPGEWDGTWRLALVETRRRAAADRGAFRTAADHLHLAELREGVWGRPDNLGGRSPSPPSEGVVAAQATWWTGAIPPGDPRELAESVWALASMRDRGDLLARRLNAVMAELTDDRLAEAFVVGAAVAQFLRRDPLLPAELLPDRWPGDELRAGYESYRRDFGAAVAAWFAG